MPHYVSLINWTDQGIQNAKEGRAGEICSREASSGGGRWQNT